MADDAGALLVRAGLVSTSAFDDARARVERGGGTLGEHLVAVGAVADDALTEFYRQRLLVPQVNPNTLARLSAKVVGAIPPDMAIELRSVPVSLDADNNLTVAMSDPSDRHAVDEIAFFTGAYVVRAVATQMQIAWCLAHYYGHVTLLGQRLIQPTAGPAVAAAAAAAPTRARGLTGKVEAQRHRALAPITAPVDVQRPNSGELDAVAGAPAAPTAEVIAGAVPDAPQPRARSVSGEIRVPSRRAQSIRPPMPEPLEDDDGPEITVEARAIHDDATGPRMVPIRRTTKPDPPELAARAGEMSGGRGARGDHAVDDQPRIIVDQDELRPPVQPAVSGELDAAPAATIEVDDTSMGVVIHEHLARESEPVLLERRRPSEPQQPQQPRPPVLPAAQDEPATTVRPRRAPTSDDGADTTDDDVVFLDAIKPARPATRSERPTQVGVAPPPARAHRDTEATGVPAGMADTGDTEAAPTPPDDTDEVRAAPVAPASHDDTNPHLAPPPPAVAPRTRAASIRPPSIRPSLARAAVVDDDEGDDDDDDDDLAPPPRPVTAAVATGAAGPPQKLRIDYDPLDDGWGPPGTTIPPPLLGALPGSDDERDGDDSDLDRGIPLASLDSAPLLVAPPTPPETARSSPAIKDVSGPSLVRALELSTSRSIELIHALERAADRDAVVALMIAHLGEAHRRAGFFSIKGGALTVFALQPAPVDPPTATLPLAPASTLQDVVGTRLPYRGPMHDDASRGFLAAVLGACPPEILLVPVAVRERVVGVLFGEHRMRHTFDDQLALAARAAGMALERILVSRRP